MDQVIRPSEGFEYYGDTVYWNNFDDVNGELGRKITGEPHGNWRAYIKEKFGRASRALFVHCGNGWVERDFYNDGLIDEAVGTDIDENLINQARAAAQDIDMPAEYHVLDTNTSDFSQMDVDWVVNHAAFHHIAYIDRTVRSLAKGLPPNGLLIGYDYTGPHRNQYPWEDWSHLVEFNNSLPEKYRADLRYPHLRTMLATDPTEAIHSELILDVCRRYFDFIEIKPLGGAISYQLLYNNFALHKDQHEEEARAVLHKIIHEDDVYTGGDPARSYFNFFVGRPKPHSMDDVVQLEAWTREEEAREAVGREHGGRYEPPSALELIYETIYGF